MIQLRRIKCKPVRQHLFRIKICVRSSHVGRFHYGLAEKLMSLDGVGFFWKYNPKNEKAECEPSFIRRHLMGRESQSIIIEAPTVEEAIRSFYTDWEGAKVGGEDGTEEKHAMWIDRDETIVQLPQCPNLCWDTFGDDNWIEKRLICGSCACKQGQKRKCEVIHNQSYIDCSLEEGDYECEGMPCDWFWNWFVTAKPGADRLLIDGRFYKFISIEQHPTDLSQWATGVG